MGSFNDTSQIKVPELLIDQVIGQEEAVKIIKKAASQRRNVLLVGEPGTGKSLLASAMANVMPIDKLQDIMVYPNEIDSNVPLIRVVENGEAKKSIENITRDEKTQQDSMKLISFIIPMAWFIISSLLWQFKIIPDVVYAATLIVGAFLVIGTALSSQMKIRSERMVPKLLIDNSSKNRAPFVDATGARAGSLFGDVKHDPLQSGGLGTPAHLRVVPGMIHRANKGVLFIDEIATLSDKSQQDLLTAMQEKKASITGQSDLSSGAMVRTEPVPCDFVLVAAGNYQDLERLHPALRSRIRGYGYEVYMNKDMDDNENNKGLIAQFVAQEVQKDGKIPHFTKDAVDIIIFEARKNASSKNKLTLKFRELGGLVRAAGDLARERGKKLVESTDVIDAKSLSRTLEEQMISKHIDLTKDYKVFSIKGESTGKVNGLAVLSDMQTGTIIPIEAEVAPAQSKYEGKIIATGKLGDIAKEAVINLSAIIKRIANLDLQSYDIHIQFLQTYSGVEGDSASISVTTAVISAIEKLPIDQTVAMTGSLSVKGEVLPVGGVSAKVRAAIKAGFKKVIIPYANTEDLVLLPQDKEKIEVISAKNLYDVLKVAIVDSKEKTNFIKKMKKVISE